MVILFVLLLIVIKLSDTNIDNNQLNDGNNTGNNGNNNNKSNYRQRDVKFKSEHVHRLCVKRMLNHSLGGPPCHFHVEVT